MFNVLMTFLELHGIDIQNCRGLSYDNANAMSGKYSGLQARVKERKPKAAWIPCAGHSLNLVGKNAAECCITTVFVLITCNSYMCFYSFVSSFFSAAKCILQKSSNLRI